ncbi:MAG: hypothetical protein SAqPseu_38770 [Shewanella algae]
MENRKWPADLMLEIAIGLKNEKWPTLDVCATRYFEAPAINMCNVLRMAEA